MSLANFNSKLFVYQRVVFPTSLWIKKNAWFNPFHLTKIFYFEWSAPWHYFVIVSGISFGSIYGIHFLTFYPGILTFYSDIPFRHHIWHLFYSDILSGILSGIHSGIYSGIFSGILSDMGAARHQPRAPDLSGECPLRSGARRTRRRRRKQFW